MKNKLIKSISAEFAGSLASLDISTQKEFSSMGAKNFFIDKSLHVINQLIDEPYAKAKEISSKNRLNQNEIKFLYKLIQQNEYAPKFLKQSKNRDYFRVVDNYFNKKLYTVVFFVGTNCPSRCVYCPNVYTDEKGKRKLRGYNLKEARKIEKSEIEKIFNDLIILREKGSDLLVKISGGLEPLTDIQTIEWISSFAKQAGIATKLFTNGLLFNSEARRKSALDVDDIRISLSTSHNDEYSRICFSSDIKSGKGRALDHLIKNIKNLVKAKKQYGKDTKIGFNSIIIPENLNQIEKLIDLALELKIDYIDFKPDYFSVYSDDTQKMFEERLFLIKEYSKKISPKDLYINFTDSLNRSNLYWKNWDGYCDCVKQSNFKLFITPYGDCSPVHYGAFPDKSEAELKFTIGKISKNNSLFDVLTKPRLKPRLPLKKLNPFELMLSLETMREEEDEKFGIPVYYSPYHTSLKNNPKQ